MARQALTVNGRSYAVEVDDPDMPLLYALRDDLGLNNPRFGCGLGQCGACTVHIDGIRCAPASRRCRRSGTARSPRSAGLGTPEKPHPMQQAWLDEQVVQCAYCINGWIMTAAALLAEKPHPTEAEIKDAFASLICRCGTHGAAIRAVKRAAQSKLEEASHEECVRTQSPRLHLLDRRARGRACRGRSRAQAATGAGLAGTALAPRPARFLLAIEKDGSVTSITARSTAARASASRFRK